MARWGAAVLVTVAAFGVATWASDALLSLVMTAEADRWVVAAGLGVAVAALAALWGHSWAARDRAASSGGDGPPSQPPAVAQGERSVAAGGDITGIASTGDDTTNTQQR
jgi:hypothetical protein